MGFSSTTSATPIRRYAQATLTLNSIASTTLQQPTPTPTPTPSKTMKLTVAALALLVAGASYADMAAAWDAPLKEALFNSGEVYGFRHGCSLGTNKEKCTGLVF